VSESVAAVILAAGHGRRMGIGKHKLQIGAGTFLQRAVETCAGGGLDPVICVVAPGERDGVAAIFGGAVHVVVNPDADRGMLSSVMEGVRHAGDCRAALVFPVDHPFVSPRTLHDLLRQSAERPGHFIKPMYRGRGGHPVVIPEIAFSMILKSSPSLTLREVIAGSGIPVDRVEVEDKGVLRNINTLEDLHEE
jgi:molybdenum cofactor cytidylyltransferase